MTLFKIKHAKLFHRKVLVNIFFSCCVILLSQITYAQNYHAARFFYINAGAQEHIATGTTVRILQLQQKTETGSFPASKLTMNLLAAADDLKTQASQSSGNTRFVQLRRQSRINETFNDPKGTSIANNANIVRDEPAGNMDISAMEKSRRLLQQFSRNITFYDRFGNGLSVDYV